MGFLSVQQWAVGRAAQAKQFSATLSIAYCLYAYAYIVTENTAVFLFIGYLWVAYEKSVPLIGRRRGEQEHVQAN